MAEKLRVPIHLPRWMHSRVLKVKLAFLRPAPTGPAIDTLAGLTGRAFLRTEMSAAQRRGFSQQVTSFSN
jgi:hypothetical protein